MTYLELARRLFYKLLAGDATSGEYVNINWSIIVFGSRTGTISGNIVWDALTGATITWRSTP